MLSHIKSRIPRLLRSPISWVQLIGFAVAIATATILYLTAMFELSFDSFHTNKERIGLLYMRSEERGAIISNSSMASPLAPLLLKELPEVEASTRVLNAQIMLRHGDKEIASELKYVDASFLKIFSFPMDQGNETALDNQDGLVINEAMAESLFGSKQVLGKAIELNLNGNWESRIITGVSSVNPRNSSISFSSLMRFEQSPNFKELENDWSYKNHAVYVKLKAQAIDAAGFQKATLPFINQHEKVTIEKLKRDGAKPDANGAYLSLRILPLKDVHLSDIGKGEVETSKFPWILLIISGLILFIAGSNFVNLSLASAMTRIKEIGTRKTIGGSTFQLFMQFWMESAFICVLSLLLGLALSGLLLPEYNATLNYQFKIAQLFSPLNISLFLTAFLLLTIITGGYPALRMANVNIIDSLKGNSSVKSTYLQNSLTVLQFSIAMILCIATVIISYQLHYLSSRPLGFNKTEVISIPIGQGIDANLALERMRNTLAAFPWVKSVSASDINLGRGRDGSTSTSRFGFDQDGTEIITNYLSIDYDYLNTLGIKLLAGRDFDRQHKTDENAVLINKEMADLLGGTEKALNSTLEMDNNPTIVGIVDNFHFHDLKREVGPLTMGLPIGGFDLSYIFVRISSSNLQQSLKQVEDTWKSINPKASIAASYLDENTQNLYNNDRRIAKIVIAGASVAIAISCLGLFALTLLLINGKIKEIGIRKVLGSSITNIILLLSKNFLMLIGLAFLISTPIAWLLMSRWLEAFAFRIAIQWWMFALAGGIALGFAMLTVAWQTFKAARVNPASTLKEN